ncbi:MAG TPA: hypothetical protein PLW65_03045 [Pseudomonadota bacterium]|nr:hypothetical protein [Pseudomonadota bacterium]
MPTSRRRLSPLALVLFAAALFFGANEAHAQRRVVIYYGRPVEKAGLFMMNFRGGPAFGVANADNSLRFVGALGVDLGFAVSRDYNAYIVLTPQLQLRDSFFNISLPIGFQYDIRIARGLYLYPRASIGYSALIFTSSFDYGPFRYYASTTVHGGILIPEFGLKYVVNGRLNLGFEPFSLPVFFNGDGYNIWYRFMFYIGFNA